MTESMRSHEPTAGVSATAAAEHEALEVNQDRLAPSIVIGQFLTQCRHTAVKPKEELAEFILAALNDSPADDWMEALQAQCMTADDDQFERLLDSDLVFLHIYHLLVKTKSIVGKGEPMSRERKALIELMDLRVGESNGGKKSIDGAQDESWEAVLAKLFPDLA